MHDTSHTMMAAAADIGPRDILEDYSVTEDVFTMGGLHLRLAIVCDGVGGQASGERAAYLTANTVIDFVRNSSDTIVGRMLTQAIQAANSAVFNDPTSGKSTIAMIAIQYDGTTPFGRVYIASVGDSGVFLIREGDVKRLNTEHNVANELIMRGEASPQDAYAMPNATHLTRAIGVNPEVEVDVGIYYNVNNAREARDRGKAGFKLQEGDTLFSCSDGLTDSGQSGVPYVQTEDFLRHALDNDVERTAKMYLSYALRSGTHDNVSIALVFVDSKKRRVTDSSARRGVPVPMLVGFFVILLLLVAASAFVITNQQDDVASQREELSMAEQTSVARETAAAVNAQTAVALSTVAGGEVQALTLAVGYATETAQAIQSLTPTPSATFTPSPTPTNTPTLLPRLDAGQGGFVFSLSANEPEVMFVDQSVTAPEDEPLYIAAYAGEERRDVFSYFYLAPESVAIFDDVTENKVDFLLREAGDVFIHSENLPQGTEIELEVLPDARFFLSGSCMSIEQFDNFIDVSCYSGNCEYTLDRFEETTTIEPGFTLNIELNEDGEPRLLDAEEIDIERARFYDDLLQRFGSRGIQGISCAGQWLPEPTPTPAPTFTPLPPTETPRPTNAPQSQAVDQDQDGVPDQQDPCWTVNGDGSPSGCPDDDRDGISYSADNCPELFGEASANGCPDSDGDGVRNTQDNCPNNANPGQADNDIDGQGDPCDADDDNDGVNDGSDNCPTVSGPSGAGGCPDADNDNVPDTSDNCPNSANTNQANNDGDGQGDACDSDDDNDGVNDGNDNCRTEAGPAGAGGCPDGDGDNVPDSSDNCPNNANASQTNTDGDGQGDACDGDDDNDGVDDGGDNCPLVAGQATASGCPDADGDGVRDSQDNCPNASNAGQENLDGDSLGDACDDDLDGDGVNNTGDSCPNTAGSATASGCPDADGDGVRDSQDNCPNASNAGQENLDGDSLGDACDDDLDGDGVNNTGDSCPNTAGSATASGCPDADGDGVRDSQDNCPNDGNTNQANQDGDAFGDVCDGDIDGDGVDNGPDNCPNQAGPAGAGGCPDGDGDNVPDSQDTCPGEGVAGQVDANGCPLPPPDGEGEGEGEGD